MSTNFALKLALLAAALQFACVEFALGIKLDEEFDVNLELIKHQPCAYKEDKSKWRRKLEFEPGTDKAGPKLVARAGQPQCYSIGGRVTVYEEFRGEFSVYLELRSSANKKHVPESCTNQKPDGCGGFGSCLYCDACETLAASKTLKAQLLLDGRPIGCGEGLSAGAYDNLELAFCLPDLNEILDSQGLSKESFKSLAQTEDAQALRSMGVFATIYVFDTTSDVKKLMQTQMKVEAVFRKSKRSFFRNEPLPADVYWSLPFNQLIKEQRGYVACHKIYGNVKIRATNATAAGAVDDAAEASVDAAAALMTEIPQEFSRVH